jgi:hypothetical protein
MKWVIVSNILTFHEVLKINLFLEEFLYTEHVLSLVKSNILVLHNLVELEFDMDGLLHEISV